MNLLELKTMSSSHLQAWISDPRRNLSSAFIRRPYFSLRRQAVRIPKTLVLSMITESTSSSKRLICPSCSKPSRTCLCGRFQSSPLDNSISVTILQHSLETKHPLNSTRIAKLGLKNVVVATVSDVSSEARFEIRLTEGDGEGVELSTPTVWENVTHSVKFAETKFSINGLDSNADITLENEAVSAVSGETIFVEAPSINVTIGKYGTRSSCELHSLPQSMPQNPNFGQLLGVPKLASALANGFVVKKLQSTAGSGAEEPTEFELNVPHGSILLFPSDKAMDVKDLVSMGIDVRNLIVLDGTWAKATRMYNENPWLKALPHLKLDLGKTSLYGEVRTQPRQQYLSTIESIVYTLLALGDSPEGLGSLLDVFESMVGDQRRCMQERLSKLR